MITHHVTIKKDYYIHEGRKYSGTDALGAICRNIGSGRVECYRDGVLSLTVDDAASRGERSLFYTDKGGYNYRKYVPFDRSRFSS